MTTNLPPYYNQSQSYLPQTFQGYSNAPLSAGLARGNYSQNMQPNLNVSPPQTFNTRRTPMKIPSSYVQNQNYSQINQPYPPQNIRSVSPNVSQENINPQYLNRPINQIHMQRNNNFINQPDQVRSQSPVYQHKVYPPQSYQPPIYGQPSIYGHSHVYGQQNMYPQKNIYPAYQNGPYSNLPSTYYQPMVQGYVPLYTPTPGNNNYQKVSKLQYDKMKRNIPQQSLNSNFNYEQANFDVNYSVEQNLVHCVICNQTYKAAQKRQHLQLHRQKARNINIRPVDEKQLQRLSKYNKMSKKGLIIKPIVQPDEFNVQYNPNQFILKKVTRYRDVDAPFQNNIQIQTQNIYGQNNHLINSSNPHNRSHSSSPSRPHLSQNLLIDDNSRVTNPRITNTRFNNDSIRQQQKIFLSDKLNDTHPQGQALKSNYHNQSFQESERRSNSASRVNENIPVQKLGYNQGLHYRNAESIVEGDIPLRDIISQANRNSLY